MRRTKLRSGATFFEETGRYTGNIVTKHTGHQFVEYSKASPVACDLCISSRRVFFFLKLI